MREHCCRWDSRRNRILTQTTADVTVVSAGRLQHPTDKTAALITAQSQIEPAQM